MLKDLTPSEFPDQVSTVLLKQRLFTTLDEFWLKAHNIQAKCTPNLLTFRNAKSGILFALLTIENRVLPPAMKQKLDTSLTQLSTNQTESCDSAQKNQRKNVFLIKMGYRPIMGVFKI